jgi:hypothetical protein
MGDGSLSVPEDHQSQRMIKAIIADLQKHWKCEIHSKEKEKYCWKSEGICYELSHNNLGFWAIEIVGFDVDEAVIVTDRISD